MPGTNARANELVKQRTKTLIREIGIDRACAVTGRSKATLRRFYSQSLGNAGQLLPLADIFALEQEAAFPHITAILAQIAGGTLDFAADGAQKTESVNSDIIQLTERFGSLMSEYYRSIADDKISSEEAERLLTDAAKLQAILVDMKRNLEREMH